MEEKIKDLQDIGSADNSQDAYDADDCRLFEILDRANACREKLKKHIPPEEYSLLDENYSILQDMKAHALTVGFKLGCGFASSCETVPHQQDKKSDK